MHCTLVWLMDWHSLSVTVWVPLQYKNASYHYRDSHYKDKTVSWPSFLYNENPHNWKDDCPAAKPRPPNSPPLTPSVGELPLFFSAEPGGSSSTPPSAVSAFVAPSSGSSISGTQYRVSGSRTYPVVHTQLPDFERELRSWHFSCSRHSKMPYVQEVSWGRISGRSGGGPEISSYRGVSARKT